MTELLIHPQLQKDCFILGKWSLCHLLLMNDSNYPWFILVPARTDINEIYQLNEEDQGKLLKEISILSKQLSELFKPEKINVAALGNVVPQLHLHVICRYKEDPAWPAPVWGKVPPVPYIEEEKQELISKIKDMKIEGLEFII